MSAPQALRPALFIDRDGTLIADAHYLANPSLVRLLQGAGHAVAQANTAGVLAIVVTNQSGIARGLITPAQYEAVRARTDALLQRAGARVDATYHCPHWPDVTGPCSCRKPGPGMYLQAAADWHIDLARSAYIGDRWRDVEPALANNGFGVLVPGVETHERDIEQARGHVSPRVRIASSLTEAVELSLAALHAKPAPHSESA